MENRQIKDSPLLLYVIAYNPRRFFKGFLMPQLEFDNIFDLIAEDPNDAADMKFRADLLLAMRDMFEQKSWGQAEVMDALNLSQPRASELMRGKVDKFSSDKLIGFLYKLGFRLRPQFVPSKRSKKKLACNVELV